MSKYIITANELNTIYKKINTFLQYTGDKYPNDTAVVQFENGLKELKIKVVPISMTIDNNGVATLDNDNFIKENVVYPLRVNNPQNVKLKKIKFKDNIDKDIIFKNYTELDVSHNSILLVEFTSNGVNILSKSIDYSNVILDNNIELENNIYGNIILDNGVNNQILNREILSTDSDKSIHIVTDQNNSDILIEYTKLGLNSIGKLFKINLYIYINDSGLFIINRNNKSKNKISYVKNAYNDYILKITNDNITSIVYQDIAILNCKNLDNISVTEVPDPTFDVVNRLIPNRYTYIYKYVGIDSNSEDLIKSRITLSNNSVDTNNKLKRFSNNNVAYWLQTYNQGGNDKKIGIAYDGNSNKFKLYYSTVVNNTVVTNMYNILYNEEYIKNLISGGDYSGKTFTDINNKLNNLNSKLNNISSYNLITDHNANLDRFYIADPINNSDGVTYGYINNNYKLKSEVDYNESTDYLFNIHYSIYELNSIYYNTNVSTYRRAYPRILFPYDNNSFINSLISSSTIGDDENNVKYGDFYSFMFNYGNDDSVTDLEKPEMLTKYNNNDYSAISFNGYGQSVIMNRGYIIRGYNGINREYIANETNIDYITRQDYFNGAIYRYSKSVTNYGHYMTPIAVRPDLYPPQLLVKGYNRIGAIFRDPNNGKQYIHNSLNNRLDIPSTIKHPISDQTFKNYVEKEIVPDNMIISGGHYSNDSIIIRTYHNLYNQSLVVLTSKQTNSPSLYNNTADANGHLLISIENSEYINPTFDVYLYDSNGQDHVIVGQNNEVYIKGPNAGKLGLNDPSNPNRDEYTYIGSYDNIIKVVLSGNILAILKRDSNNKNQLLLAGEFPEKISNDFNNNSYSLVDVTGQIEYSGNTLFDIAIYNGETILCAMTTDNDDHMFTYIGNKADNRLGIDETILDQVSTDYLMDGTGWRSMTIPFYNIPNTNNQLLLEIKAKETTPGFMFVYSDIGNYINYDVTGIVQLVVTNPNSNDAYKVVSTPGFDSSYKNNHAFFSSFQYTYNENELLVIIDNYMFYKALDNNGAKYLDVDLLHPNDGSDLRDDIIIEKYYDIFNN